MHDDSSNSSVPQEVIVEEVKRQVRLALQESEVLALRTQNEELKRAWEQSAVTLDAMLQSRDGGMYGHMHLRGDPAERYGDQTRAQSGGEGVGVSVYQGPPPGLPGVPKQPAVTPQGRDAGEQQPSRGFLREAAGRLLGMEGN